MGQYIRATPVGQLKEVIDASDADCAKQASAASLLCKPVAPFYLNVVRKKMRCWISESST